MTSDKRTYIPYIPDDLVKAVDSDAALLACKLGTFADEKGAVFVSFAFLADLWKWDERRVRKAARVLGFHDIWQYKKGDGRGHVTEWINGAKYDTFVTLKRVQNLQIKGAKSAAYNKEYNKEYKKRAYARESFSNNLINKQGQALLPKRLPRKGTRWTFNQYYDFYGDTQQRPEWRCYKPEGSQTFIFERI